MKNKNILLWTVLLCMTVVFACKSKDTIQENEDNTLIVQVNDIEAVGQLEQEFTQYDLRKIKVLSRPMNIFLFTFDSEKIKNTELLEKVKTSNLVKEAQLNRNVTTRN